MRHAHVRAVLPRLRRHAYILAGDRALADESVLECLMAYKKDPSRIRPEAVNVDLFRLFHDTTALGLRPAAAAARRPVAAVATVGAAAGSDGAAEETDDAAGTVPSGCSAVLGRFQALPPGHRQVLTLTTVEGFSTQECAQVLGLPAERVGTLLMEARRILAGIATAS